MQARMKNPAMIIGEVGKSIHGQWIALQKVVPDKLLGLIHLRTSQINGCSVCVDGAYKSGTKAGETDERLFAVAAWRHSPHFTDAERALLSLTESVTRIADSTDPVPDAIWDEAKRHYDEQQLAGILLAIATVNVWNRLNVSVRQQVGGW